MKILLISFSVPALVAIFVVVMIRNVVRRFGRQQLYANGIIISKCGIEYWGLFFTGVRQKPFSEIQSVALVPYFEVVVSVLFFRYGLSARRVPFNPFGKIVVIRLKHPNPIEYLFFTPKDAPAFVEQLQRRIKQVEPSSI